MSTKYVYPVSDTANDLVDVGSLTQEIADSTIAIALDYIAVDGVDVDIWFKAAISGAEETTLDGIVAAHTGEPLPDVQDVSIDNFGTLEDPTKNIQRVVVQPGRTGYYMCDRDVKVCTSMYAAADALEDLKVIVSDNTQEPWGEFSLVGCYKLSEGAYVSCDDQDDANANAVLSVFDFLVVDQTTEEEIEYDFKGGCLWSDAALEAPVWDHRLYAMMAPNIPPANGGGVRFFDGYLYPYQGKWQECISSLSLKVDPSVSVEAARIRFWIYYPAGAKQTHVLRTITYRQPATF